MLKLARALGVAATLAVAALAQPSQAEDYPTRPVLLLVGLAAGGGTDTVARIVGERLSRALGQPVVVENKPGMGGTLAAQAALAAAPDGYTLLFAGPNHVIAKSLYKKLPIDFQRDAVPVAGVMRTTNLMVVPPSLPVKTVQEFIDYGKAHPGKLSMASTGVGTSVHLSGELFKAMTKIEMVHVPYRGSAPAYPDLVTGKVDVLFENLTGSIQFVETGALRALGVTSAKRWQGLPDIPAIAETVPGYEADVWYGIVAPKGTPPWIIEILSKAMNAALSDPALIARFAAVGGLPMPMSPEQFGKLIADESEKWRKVIEDAGISID
jgi:tripartite-type tricarboxylate transporter receptor subunit TctC